MMAIMAGNERFLQMIHLSYDVVSEMQSAMTPDTKCICFSVVYQQVQQAYMGGTMYGLSPKEQV